jgi:three-Cys-motif partner protein
MSNDKFFDKSREQSLVKSKIVDKYFWSWAKIMMPRAKRRFNPIAYIDLLSGPGRYDDGVASTPLLIL